LRLTPDEQAQTIPINKPMKHNSALNCIRSTMFAAAILWSLRGHSQLQFTGVAAGDASTGSAIVWTRALDPNSPAGTLVTGQVSTDPAFGTLAASSSGTPGAGTDYTLKFEVTGLSSGTRYYYRFTGPAGEMSDIGTFKTAPAPDAETGVHFAFSGDCDGLIRPY